jgi:signal transduction histidine kinase
MKFRKSCDDAGASLVKRRNAVLGSHVAMDFGPTMPQEHEGHPPSRTPGAVSRPGLQEQIDELQAQVAEFAAQRAAISAVLRAIASSPHDLQPIFDTIAESAKRLCRADVANCRLVEDAGLRLVARTESPSAYVPPKLIAPGSFYDPLIASKAAIHVPDFAAHELYRAGEPGAVALVKGGYRSFLFVPMLRNDELIGTIALGRQRVEHFTTKEIELVADFAAQATIALQITRRERQYREVQTDLAHANRVAVIGQLTASIAHELRQPLTAVDLNGSTGLRWLAMQPPDLAKAKLALERAIESARRGSDIISGLSDLTSKQPLRKEPVDLNEAIQEVTVLTHGEADKHGVSLQTRLANRLAHVHGDRLQLQQVVLNLAVNAIQAMSATDGGPRELLISTECIESDGVRVGVRDTGPGLSPKCLPRLFEPFYSTKAGGMGMGLAICRSIIEAHGGRLSATACEPQGALFEFALPACAGG